MQESTTQQATSQIKGDTIERLNHWVGKTESLYDIITPAPMHGLSITLDSQLTEVAGAPEAGTILPPLWHWLYFLPRVQRRDIGKDGHGKLGGFLPPVPLPRRMWAGGRLQWVEGNPIRVGDEVRRVSSIESIKPRLGRSGDLVFVIIKHKIYNQLGLAIIEEQDIVYREAAKLGLPLPQPMPAPQEKSWSESLQADPVLLFRYSALTFNSHRIHFDRDYATTEEGYVGLVVHGPLIATLLANLACRNTGAEQIKSFNFKALQPLHDGHQFSVNGRLSSSGDTAELWSAAYGAMTMQASVGLW